MTAEAAMNRNEKLDVLGTFLRTVQREPSAELLVITCARMGPQARLSDVYSKMGLGEDQFAQILGDAESKGLVRREQVEGRVNLILTPAGRQLYEQAMPQ
jgi:DNA-binding MarR family transcriptional regulator